MKSKKVINVTLSLELKDCYILEFASDDENNVYGILTCPYIKWLDIGNRKVLYRSYNISGKELEFIEKHYFDKNKIAISIIGYPYSISMEDFLHKVIPENIFNQMISGTFKLSKKKKPGDNTIQVV